MAVDLRHVREVFTLGPVAPVPTAPRTIAGVVNLRGAVVPVLSLGHLAEPATERAARAGDPVVLVEIEGARAALAVERVDEVTTVWETPAELPGELMRPFVDARGRRTLLLDSAGLVAATRREVERAGAVGG